MIMEKNMTKEKITLENIKKDLRLTSSAQHHVKSVSLEAFIIPIVILAVCIGILTRSFWIGLMCFLPCLGFICWYIVESKKHSEKKCAIDQVDGREDISISIEEFSHFSVETVYEPRLSRRKRDYKDVTYLNFKSGLRCRLYPGTYYSWSKTMYLSSKGIKNTSVKGNEFICVSLQGNHDAVCFYPSKFFELDDSLKKYVKKD